MQGSGDIAPSRNSLFTRLSIAFLLGLPTGIFSYFTLQASHITWWQSGVPITILVGAMLLSVFLDTKVRQGTISTIRTIISVVAILILTAIFIIVTTLLPQLNQGFVFLTIALVPFSTGLAGTFSVGSTDTWRTAFWISLVTWAGTGIPVLIVAIIKYIDYERIQPGGIGGIVLPFSIAGVVIGFILAAPGGITGKLLRNFLLQ